MRAQLRNCRNSCTQTKKHNDMTGSLCLNSNSGDTNILSNLNHVTPFTMHGSYCYTIEHAHFYTDLNTCVRIAKLEEELKLNYQSAKYIYFKLRKTSSHPLVP
eukprot:NODE_521_length_7287_cov_0.275042.p6 type:complete len:103 gc:universal NODE_521_length_7287_cov_0.275042:4084-3776(-)